MTTQYYTATSLNGFIATLDDSLDWLFPLGDIAETSYPGFIRQVGALAMGSSTYEWMLRNVVGPDARRPNPWPYSQPTWVFTTRTLPVAAESDIRFASGDVRPIHEAMVRAAEGKNVWIVGGGELVGQFYDQGLLDEIIAQVGSVTLGSGKPLLPRSITHPPLELISAKPMGKGFAELRYTVPKFTPHTRVGTSAGESSGQRGNTDLVRQAEESDVDSLATIWYEGWQDAHAAILPSELARLRTRESFRERLRAGLHNVRVVGPVGSPIGFCMTKDEELYQLYVSPEGRGKGVAALLEADAVEAIAARGSRVAWLACAIGNDRAARFYDKRGWRRVGTAVSHLETQEGIFPLEVWRYEKALDARVRHDGASDA